jgi:hypothetical protein
MDGLFLQSILFAIVFVEFRLDLAQSHCGRRIQHPGAGVAFINMRDISRHDVYLAKFPFSPHGFIMLSTTPVPNRI